VKNKILFQQGSFTKRIENKKVSLVSDTYSWYVDGLCQQQFAVETASVVSL
jgi:hypothetical protein